MRFKESYKEYLDIVNDGLEKYLPIIEGDRKIIFEAMRYSLMAGGKRIRPILTLAVCDMFKFDLKEALPFALAIEMIHTYSLIHDDLPAMDNDDLRRGMPTNHKVYGEAMAILAGDGLLNYAFEIMSGSVVKDKENAFGKSMALNVIAKLSGVNGMIGGQVIDIESSGKNISKERLRGMHELKTGALLRAPVLCATYLCGLSEKERNLLDIYASKIGLAFQIKDDILDVEGETEKIGKPCGSDEYNHKVTFVSLFGVDESKKLLQSVTEEALESISYFGDRAVFLTELAKMLSNRDS
jgi:geranylgeranyl diphosphate synthase type II